MSSTGCQESTPKKMKQPLLLSCVQPPSLQNKLPEFGTNYTICFLQITVISLQPRSVGIVLGPCLVVTDLEGHVRLDLLDLCHFNRPVEDSLSIPRAHSRLEKDSHPGNTVRKGSCYQFIINFPATSPTSQNENP